MEQPFVDMQNYVGLFSADSRRKLLSLSDMAEPPPLEAEPESTGFFDNLGAGWLQSVGMRSTRRIRRALEVGIADGDSEPVNPDEWFRANKESFLTDGVRGRFIYDRYLAGAYDLVNSEDELMAALTFDYEEGNRLDTMSRASGLGMVGSFGGALLDPSNYILAYALPLTAGTSVSLNAGRTAQASLAAGRSLAVGEPTIRGSLAIGAGMSAIQNALDLGLTPEQEDFGDYLSQFATDIAADSALTYAFKYLPKGISQLRNLKDRIGRENTQLAEGLSEGMDAEIGSAAIGRELDPPSPVQTDLAKKQREVLSGLPQTAEIRQLRRQVDGGISQIEFDERLTLIRQGATELADAPLFGVELEETLADSVRSGRIDDFSSIETLPIRNRASNVASVESRRTFELPPDPDRIDPVSGRPIYNFADDARRAKDAEGDLFPARLDTLSSQIDNLPPDELADAVLALSPDEVDQLNRVMSAIEEAQTVPYEDFNEHVAEALNRVANRSPNLSWNPARLGDPRGTFNIKIDQPVNATVVGFTPTNNLEDIMLALKKLGLREGAEQGADAPPTSFNKPGVRRGASGGWKITGQADFVSEMLLSYTGRARDYSDLTPDFRNDDIRKLASELSKGKVSPESKGLLGSQAAWGPFANRLAFSQNPVLSHFFGVVAKSDVHSKGLADSYRLSQPLEAISEHNRVVQRRQQIVVERGFLEYLRATDPNASRLDKRIGRSLRTSNGRLSLNLMSKGERLAWDKYNHMLELLRIASNDLPVAGGRIKWLEERAGKDWIRDFSIANEWLADTIRWAYTPESSEPLRKALIDLLRSEKQVFDSTTVRRMSDETTTLDLSHDISFHELYSLLRDVQGIEQTRIGIGDGGADIRIADNKYEDVFRPYLRLTDGKAPLIARADFEAALAGNPDRFVRAVVNAHNSRMRGIVPIKTSALSSGSLYNLLRQQAGNDRPIATYNATDAIAARWEAQTRLEWAEGLARSLALLRDLERRDTPDYDLLDPALDGYASIVQWRSRGQWREFTDGVERWLDEAIDAHASHANRWITNNAKDEKAARKLVSDVKAAKAFASSMVGHNPAEIRGEAQKAGLAARDFVGMLLLGRQVFAQAPEVARTITRATSLAAGKRIQPLVHGITRDLSRMAERGDDLGMLLNQVESIQEGMNFHISRRMDLMPNGSEADAVPLPTAMDRAGTWLRLKGRGMIFIGSLGKHLNDATATAATLIANERFVVDIPKAIKAEARIAKGEEVVAAVKAVGLGYPEYQYIRRYLSEDSLQRMNAIFEEGSKETVRNRKGKEIVEIWAPRDRMDQQAIREYALLLSRYADRQVRFVPQASDSFATGDPQGVILNWTTQFLKPTIAGTNALVLSRANAGLGSKSFDISLVALFSFLSLALRNYVSGRGEQFEEEASTLPGLSRQIYESLGYAGVIGWIPDKFGAGIYAATFGGDDFRSRRSVDYALDTPVQSTGKRILNAVAGGLSGDPTPGEWLYLRRILSGGVSDTVMAHLLRIIVDETGLSDELGVDEVFDWIYPETNQ